MAGENLKEQIYTVKQDFEAAMQQIENKLNISPANIKSIKAFIEDGRSRGLSPMRLLIYLQNLKRLSKHTEKDFAKFSLKDCKEMMTKIEENRKYGGWTKNTSKSILKQFLKFLNVQPEVYSWIKPEKVPSKLQKEDLLLPEEISRIVAACPDTQWKAMISILAETGCRPGELLNLKIQDVILNTNHIKLIVRGKMEKRTGPRPIYIMKNRSLLQAWLEQHPNRTDSSSPLWISRRQNKPITLYCMDFMLRKIAIRAKIAKKVYPYIFRHTRATEVYCTYSPPVAQKLMGHDDLEMSKVYVHLSENDVLDALAVENGQKPEIKQENIDQELCQICQHKNPYGAIQCEKCHNALNSAGQIKVEKEYELLKQPEIERILKAMLVKVLNNPAELAELQKIKQ